MARAPLTRFDIPGIDWDRLLERLFGPAIASYFQRVRETRERIEKLKRDKAAEPNANIKKLIQDAIDSSEKDLKFNLDMIKRLLKQMAELAPK